MADDPKSHDDELASAIAAAKKKPQDFARWDRVEELLDSAQRPEAVSELFTSTLVKGSTPDMVSELGPRGVRFYETWFGEDSKELVRWLEQVSAIDPQSQWAFERLTVALTVAESWSDLLDAYDRALSATDDTSRRMRLLEEGAQVAKDFAGAPDRAIGYMLKSHALDPDNQVLAAGLERLLERQERWSDLVALWESRLGMQGAKQARDARLKIAGVYLDKLGRFADVLAQVKTVLADAPQWAPAYELLERVLASDRAGASERRDALTILRQHFVDTRAPAEVVRVVERGLGFAKDGERRAVLRELVERLTALDEDERAMKHQAELLALEPTPTERDALQALCNRTRDYALYAQALLSAADGSTQPQLAAELRLEAARTLQEPLNDSERAIALYQRVFGSDAPHALLIDAGRRLCALLDKPGREPALLAALARMSELEQEPHARALLLGKLARLSDQLGDSDRAEVAWKTRLEQDAGDVEALDALVTGAAERQDWQGLCSLLERRIQLPAAEGRRRPDLVWLASTYAERLGDLAAAIEVWRRIETTFGQDNESVAALTDLLSRAERWPDLAEVLAQAAARQINRFTELQTRLADAYRERLGKPELAAERYRSALQVDPRDEAALRGQHALLSDARCVTMAVSSLCDAYRSTGEWRKQLDLLDVRLAVETAMAGKAKLLSEAAELYEQRAQDPKTALSCLRRAFAYAPEDRATEKEIRRLAERLNAWDAVVAAYRETIANLARDGAGSAARRTPRIAELRHDEAKVLEERLGDAPGAYTAYAEAATLAPERVDLVHAAVRSAAGIGRWEGAADHLVAGARASGGLDQETLSDFERAAAKARAWDVVTSSMTAAIERSELPGKLARELHARVAMWHRKLRKDDDAAEAALVKAVAAEPRHGETLRALAELQRRVPGEALCDTLLALSELDRGDLDPLLEAAEVVMKSSAPPAKRKVLFEQVYERAADMLRRGQTARGQTSVEMCARKALDQILTLDTEGGRHEQAFASLLAATALPFNDELRKKDLHRAARIALNDLRDDVRASSLYRDLLQRDPEDRVALTELSVLFERGDRLPELLALRRHELRLETELPKQLALRLSIAKLIADLEARGGRLQVLQDNLRAEPGHPATLVAVSELLRGQRRHAELAELLRKQGQQLGRKGETARAVNQLREAAQIYERELSDVETAMDCYRELHDLDPASDASAALARLHGARGEHAQAAKWLEIRLGTAAPETRGITAIELARALLEAGDRPRARTCLEQALRDDPSSNEARELLAGIYRHVDAYEPLAALLIDSAGQQSEPAQALALLREAADIYCDRLGAPGRAIAALQRAAKLAPGERDLSTKLAESLASVGRFDEARAVIERLIEGYGRKRSPERAELHHRLARVARQAGDIARAFEELETATKMDLGHIPAMYLLAELSHEQGDLDRAERAYRGLLMMVRRHRQSDGPDSVGQSEIFYALHAIAKARGQEAQTRELLESAMEAASQHEAEAARFQRKLRARGDVPLLMRLLDARMGLTQDPAAQAEILATRADVLAEELGKPAEALSALLDAIERTPESEALHERARTFAAAAGELDRYISRVSSLADETARRKDEHGPMLAAWLTLRLGEAIELGVGDLDRAAGLYARVESSGFHLAPAWMALARVAGARGDSNEQRRVLQHLTELDDKQATAEQRKLAQFALAELELGNNGWRAAGVKSLERALEGLTDYDRPKALLRAAVQRAPKDEALSTLFERVARASRDPMMLLEHFERRVAAGELTLAQMHEPIELALRQGEHARAEALLERAAALAEDTEGSQADKVWLRSRLSDCRRQAGDVAGAVAQLARAAEAAEGDEADALWRDLAELAMSPGGDLEVAAAAYLHLLGRDYGNRDLCIRLLRVYASIGDRARFEQFAERCGAELSLSVDRVAVYMAHARFLIDVVDDERAAVPVLKTLLEEEPGQAQATEELSAILQKHGMNEELADLLQTHFDRARDAQNLEAIAELAMRISSLYGESRRDAAIDVLRGAVEWHPGHAGLLRALLARMGTDGEPRDRADVMHNLLAVEQGPAAAELALQLAPLWIELGDSERAGEALQRGLSAAPDHAELRDKLEAFYGEQEQWRLLAELLERDAERLGPDPSSVARLRNAASLYREQLDDLDAAAGALRKALAIAPRDLGLLGELARNLAAAGRHEEAVNDVTRLLHGHDRVDEGRVQLLLVRAELRIAIEQLQDAVSDLEEAYDIDAAAARTSLIDALERQKTAAFTSGDPTAERRSVMRLIEVYDAAGDATGARDALGTWVEQSPDDIEALRALRARDTAAERWDDVVTISERLIDMESGEEKVQSAIALADACQNAGRGYDARGVLEHVREQQPENQELRGRLRALYEMFDCKAELAGILLEDVPNAFELSDRVALLQRAARLYLELGDTEAALGPLGAASELSPEDMETQLLVVDIAIQRGQLADAQQRLDAAINVHRKRRSPELALLYQRMGRLSAAQGDVEEQLKWLNQAMEIDRRSGHLAAELAEAAMAAESYDTAMKALRAITMMEDPQPMSRATAFLKQAQIAFVRGDPRRAQHWARKAKSLDENMPEIDAFLAQIEG